MTNDIFTKEDGEFLVKHGALPEERIRAVETGGCPHAAIREDISINLGPLEELSNLFKADILLCESGGGNLLMHFLFLHIYELFLVLGAIIGIKLILVQFINAFEYITVFRMYVLSKNSLLTCLGILKGSFQ